MGWMALNDCLAVLAGLAEIPVVTNQRSRLKWTKKEILSALKEAGLVAVIRCRPS